MLNLNDYHGSVASHKPTDHTERWEQFVVENY